MFRGIWVCLKQSEPEDDELPFGFPFNQQQRSTQTKTPLHLRPPPKVWLFARDQRTTSVTSRAVIWGPRQVPHVLDLSFLRVYFSRKDAKGNHHLQNATPFFSAIKLGRRLFRGTAFSPAWFSLHLPAFQLAGDDSFLRLPTHLFLGDLRPGQQWQRATLLLEQHLASVPEAGNVAVVAAAIHACSAGSQWARGLQAEILPGFEAARTWGFLGPGGFFVFFFFFFGSSSFFLGGFWCGNQDPEVLGSLGELKRSSVSDDGWCF